MEAASGRLRKSRVAAGCPALWISLWILVWRLGNEENLFCKTIQLLHTYELVTAFYIWYWLFGSGSRYTATGTSYLVPHPRQPVAGTRVVVFVT